MLGPAPVRLGPDFERGRRRRPPQLVASLPRRRGVEVGEEPAVRGGGGREGGHGVHRVPLRPGVQHTVRGENPHYWEI